MRRFSKPFLLLLVLTSLRAAIPRSSWLPRLLTLTGRHIRERLAALEKRTPWATAALDAFVAVLTVHLVLKATGLLANLLFPAARPRPFAMPFESAKLAETFAAWDSAGISTSPSGATTGTPRARAASRSSRSIRCSCGRWRGPSGAPTAPCGRRGSCSRTPASSWGWRSSTCLSERTLGAREAARRTVLYVAVFAFAYFFTQVYTESRFLLTTVSAVAAAVASLWGWAGLFGALAAYRLSGDPGAGYTPRPH